MKKQSYLLRSTIWLSLSVIALFLIVYYRSLIFSVEINQPVDNLFDDVDEVTGVSVPAYKLQDNESPLYDRVFGSSDSSNQSVNDDTPFQVVTVESTEDNNVSDIPPTVDELSDNAVENTGDNIETSDSQVISDLSMDEIILAVKETVNETLEIFVENNETQAQESLAGALPILSANELLFKARLAYWNGDFKTSEDSYVKLTTMVKDDPNSYGELGNLYYQQSKWKQASDAYYHAAILLKELKHEYQAHHLLRIIRGLDTETANKLQQELHQST